MDLRPSSACAGRGICSPLRDSTPGARCSAAIPAQGSPANYKPPKATTSILSALTSSTQAYLVPQPDGNAASGSWRELTCDTSVQLAADTITPEPFRNPMIANDSAADAEQPHGGGRGGSVGILSSGLCRWLAWAEEGDRVGDERVGLLGGGPSGGDECGDALEGGAEEQLEPVRVARREPAGLLALPDQVSDDGEKALGRCPGAGGACGVLGGRSELHECGVAGRAEIGRA